MSGVGRLSIAGPWLLTVGLFVALMVTGAVAASNDPSIDLQTTTFLVVVGLWGLVQASVGALIAWRRPENRIGRLLQVSGPLVVSVFLGYVLAAIRTTSLGPVDPVGGIAGWWASTTIFLAIFLAFPLVGILYPDGRLPGPRWRLPILIVTLAQVAMATMYAVKAGPVGLGLPDNPVGYVEVSPEVRGAVQFLVTMSLVLAMALAAVAIAVRWRRGSLVERSQLKWLFAALVVAGTLFPLSFGTSSPDESPGVAATLAVGSALLIPVAIGIAILRYRLYEIDRLISRTIAYATVTGILAVTFAGAILVFQALLAPLAGGTTVGVAASTLVVAALFQPLRRRVQSVVDRRFNRSRYDAERTAEAFAARLRDDVDLGSLRAEVRQVVAVTVAPVTVDVWIRRPDART
jgi:hypothetical protein